MSLIYLNKSSHVRHKTRRLLNNPELCRDLVSFNLTCIQVYIFLFTCNSSAFCHFVLPFVHCFSLPQIVDVRVSSSKKKKKKVIYNTKQNTWDFLRN